MSVATLLLAASLGLGLAAPLHAQEAPAGLPSLGVSNEATSVIGVSSGGYMATQLAVAWPSRFSGLGVVAAGPWACARGKLGRALGQCMFTRLGPPDLETIQARYRDYLSRDLVGAPEALADLRVFVWHGGADGTVAPSLGHALVDQFEDWLAAPDRQLRFRESADVAHGWPVGADSDAPADVLASCGEGGGSHLLACDPDIAEAALTWLHGTPSPGESDESGGKLVRFDQSDFDARGLAESGYLFIPTGCEKGGCALTVALHGCEMSAAEGDEAFVRYSGLNDRATADRRVVLYPQAAASLANPQACWDWWGYAESAWQLDPLHDSRRGSQVESLMGMVDRLQAAPAGD
ncbi:poly(3-hydroxybutyrate) depolymerase [Halomonas nitroreducens]|uniref:Poly(3-hydroxybutyrate) depolymerase n=1 Tax=Halomonas nitroreducens TaxID=447425 RepID=A0A431V5F0_9GAMM|nr:poly(3-hydroxybutyrate) depolymerase [Halomonas nitroreducens]RTR05568.1 poly(3-hydroxybutyrate) depolymerase [Halomonas nitroreducens]